MKLHQLLLEYRRDKTLDAFKDKIIAKSKKDRSVRTGRNILPPDDILGRLEDTDPTNQNKYVPWLVVMYVNGKETLEDLTAVVGDDLVVFDKLSNRKKLGDDSDLRKLNSPSELSQVVAKHKSKLEKGSKKDRKHGKYNVIYGGNNTGITVIQPLDKPAAQYFGKDTAWCTATAGANYYEQYSRNGDIYVIMPKNPRKYTNSDGKDRVEKYQLYLHGRECKDENNHSFKFSRLIKKYPEVKDVFKKIAEYEHLDHFSTDITDLEARRETRENQRQKSIDDVMASLWKDHKG